ncbi:MAG: metallophosphoesterase family protein [Thermoleophilia bacterium]|nr:metallophosphoesterase family protein [Thermoleophilia bacterium]MCZ4496315.1 metallophosphoesterase family protein [Thermoleophilia bacterium]
MTTHVLITSDTHVTSGARLPTALLELADRADHVIHAGDLVAADVHAVLGALAPITAVHGNVDDAETARLLPERAVVEIAGVRFGVVHIPGASEGRAERLRGWFPECDVVVYGHTHAPELRAATDGAPWIINPGSPVQKRRAAFHSAVWMELSDGRITRTDLLDLDTDGARAANPS